MLVERSEQLDRMWEAVARSSTQGELLLISGEAGHGKTSLIEAFVSGLDHRYTVLAASCDPVAVPTPFAALFEIIDDLPPDLAEGIRQGERRQEIFGGMLAVLDSDPTVLILEDLQWADETTLGLVRYLGRRLANTRSILVLSYRPEEVDTEHPLLVVLADLGPMASHLVVPSLTLAGVREMAEGVDAEAESIHRATGGNPFFVEEVLASPEEDLPASVGAAIMAGVSKLPTGSLDLLEMVALSPEGLDLRFAETISPETAANIDAACQRRLLVEDRGRLRCRHDLIRLTVDQSIPPARRRRIHEKLLAGLTENTSSRRDMARLAHHAVRAGDAQRAIEYSLAAATFAGSEGANRQARLHYDDALAFRDEMDRATLDRALRGSADVNCATNHLRQATETARDRLKLAGNEHDLGDRLAWSAFIASRWGNVALARADADRAVQLHEHHQECPELTRAKSVLTTLAVWEGDWRTASDLAEQNVRTASELGSRELLAAGLLSLGKAQALIGVDGWETHLEEAARIGGELGQLETVCSALNSLAFFPYWSLDIRTARERFTTGIEFAASREMDAWYVAMAASKAGCDLAAGEWETAGQVLERAIAWPTCSSTDCEARVLLATLRCRQGAADADQLVESALTQTDADGTYHERVMASVLAMEAAWLGIVPQDAASDRYRRAKALVERSGDPNATARLRYWASILGWEPLTKSESGVTARVAALSSSGFEFEARVLQATLDAPPLAEIFDWLSRRGAVGTMRALRRDLRDRGVRGVPASPRSSTTSNPGGLTNRQVDVLELLAAGHTNADIAAQLFISEKTVGHHVSAILQKLHVENRVQAAALASEHGLV